jgi:hypothetical protein
MSKATAARLARMERLILNLATSLNLYTDLIMSTLEGLQTKQDQLVTAAADAKADSVRDRARVDLAIGLIQALAAMVAELKAAGPALITQAQLDDLDAKAGAALTDLGEANTVRDQASDDLASGVTENAPAS